jgi:hypothetical protein
MRFLRNSVLLLSLIAAVIEGRAQEMNFGWGSAETPDLNETSYRVFEFGYRQYIYKDYIALSFMWPNEGHFMGHHRDGTAWEAWGNWPIDKNDRFALSLGVGAYYYFDTETALTSGMPGIPNTNLNGSPDVHGTSVIFSVAATWYPWPNQRYFFRLMGNRVSPTTDIKVNEVDAGIGVWLGHGDNPAGAKEEDLSKTYRATLESLSNIKEGTMRQEITGYFGASAENGARTPFSADRRYAWSSEYRLDVLENLNLTLSYVNETNLRIIRRQGFAGQLWAVNSFNNFLVGTGVGVYTAVGPRGTVAPGQYFTPVAAPYFSVSIGYRFTDHIFARITVNRVTGYDNPDSDVFLLGIGYRM